MSAEDEEEMVRGGIIVYGVGFHMADAFAGASHQIN